MNSNHILTKVKINLSLLSRNNLLFSVTILHTTTQHTTTLYTPSLHTATLHTATLHTTTLHKHTQTSITAEIIGGVKSPITSDSAVKFRLQSEHQTFCQPFSSPPMTFVAAATGRLSSLPRYSLGTVKFRCNHVIMFHTSFYSACTKLLLGTATLQPFLLPH